MRGGVGLASLQSHFATVSPAQDFRQRHLRRRTSTPGTAKPSTCENETSTSHARGSLTLLRHAPRRSAIAAGSRPDLKNPSAS